MPEKFTNNGTSALASGVSAAALSCTSLSGEGALFPTISSPDFFRLTFFKKSTGEIEIAYASARSGDVFTISRGEEGTTALVLSAGDLMENRPTAGFFNSLSVTDLTIQKGAYNYGADSGSANNYVVALNPIPASLTDGMPVRFKAANSNTGASTLNVNGLGTVSIKRDVSVALAPNDIRANDIIEVFYSIVVGVFLYPTASYDVLLQKSGAVTAACAANANGAITGATQTNPVSIASTAHGRTTGDRIYTDSVVGMTELNGNEYVITVVDASNYTLDGIDGTAYTAYTSGGTWYIDDYTATYSPAISALTDGMELVAQIITVNKTTVPKFAPDGLTAHNIVKDGGQALVTGDMPAGSYAQLKYDLTNTRWELMSPAIPNNVVNFNNQPPAYYLSRSNHSGIQSVSTITGLGSLALLSNISSSNIDFPNAKGLFSVIPIADELRATSAAFGAPDTFRLLLYTPAAGTMYYKIEGYNTTGGASIQASIGGGTTAQVVSTTTDISNEGSLTIVAAGWNILTISYWASNAAAGAVLTSLGITIG